jgi:hypothetical protein
MIWRRPLVLALSVCGAVASLGCSGDAQGFAAADTEKCPDPPLYRLLGDGGEHFAKVGLDGKPLTPAQLDALEKLRQAYEHTDPTKSGNCGVTPLGTAMSPYTPDAGKH